MSAYVETLMITHPKQFFHIPRKYFSSRLSLKRYISFQENDSNMETLIDLENDLFPGTDPKLVFQNIRSFEVNLLALDGFSLAWNKTE